jgi:hypothetical protein
MRNGLRIGGPAVTLERYGISLAIASDFPASESQKSPLPINWKKAFHLILIYWPLMNISVVEVVFTLEALKVLFSV